MMRRIPLGRCERLRRSVGRAAAGVVAVVACACSSAGASLPQHEAVIPGLEALLAGDSLQLVHGRRVGLITNHTGIAARGDTMIGAPSLLQDHPQIDLVALYSPEHGLTGRVEAGVKVASERHAETDLPVYSLYGEDRKPLPEMLRGVDVLLYDIQDIGARYYTYVWTMALAMEAAAEAEIPFVVLDRPNPIGGRLVQGNVLDPEYATFVGLYPVPMRHGLTPGELARLVNDVHRIGADLRVVPLRGWSRGEWFDETGLPWVPPSPNMPSLESATHYPGTCLFEGTNLSVGRGSAIAFQHVGAPWLDASAIVERLNAMGLPGVRFEATTFTPVQPGDGKYDGQSIRGIRFRTTDRTVYDPTRAAVAALIEIQRAHADRLEWNVAHFDRLAGTDRLRNLIQAGASLEEAVEGWATESAAFDELRQPYLLY